jgi:hypothetical protein
MALDFAMERLGPLSAACRRCCEDRAVSGDDVCDVCREELSREAEWDAQQAATRYEAGPHEREPFEKRERGQGNHGPGPAVWILSRRRNHTGRESV